MKTTLKAIPCQPDNPETFATDRPYRKPMLKPPYFETDLVQNVSPGTLRDTVAKLVKKPEINSQIKVTPGLLRRIWGRVK